MPRSTSAFFAAALCVSAAAPALACEFVSDEIEGRAITETLASVKDGLVPGALRCGTEEHPAYVWTLGVDGDQPSLGIRDDKLFETRHTGPLSPLLAAKVEDHVRMTVFERSETVKIARAPLTDDRFSFRRFFTFCDADGSADPLDCSVGSVRIKGRRTALDTNRDGFLDMSDHEISYYDGASKLHVIGFSTPYSDSLTADAGLWIEAINAVSDALKPREIALAD
ncbi:hypothetical protein [Oricola sp.]|uniref:hypothetical protein n=1 Tax=Oricola sp. TaxID=1979950 RepID=UPI0025F4C4E6|nr:hypothetical protein [Oricola sp.]MCI5074967.1 hypothetical protein [Oricola sp.]